MELGLHIASFTWPGGPERLAENLTRVVVAAEDAGLGRVSVMDHLWQIGPIGPPEEPMLEAYTTLGYLAARTSRVELLAWVTAVSYRDPGMLAKLVTTLDVLSNGRAWLGIGAAWNGEEAEGLGLFFPPTAEHPVRVEFWGDDITDLRAFAVTDQRSVAGLDRQRTVLFHVGVEAEAALQPGPLGLIAAAAR